MPFIGLLSCQSPNVETKHPITSAQQQPFQINEPFEIGKISPNISLQAFPNESYTLFLPNNYNTESKWPVIIFFDPHGNGLLPLTLYQTLANQHKTILIGSNNCKNGISIEQNSTFALHLIAEAQHRFAIDSTKIAMCGFSGGAKTALFTGINNGAVSHIIYSGAVIQVPFNNKQQQLLGFAGDNDMNYTDLVAFERSIPTPIKHTLIAFHGKHEWPIATTFKDAFEWLNTGKVTNYASKKAAITDTQITTEQRLKQYYLQAFQTKDINWWTNEIKLLNSKKNTEPMYGRLLGYISLACYSYSGGLLQQRNLQAAEKIITIYQLADPDNSDAKQFRVQLDALK